MKNASLIKTVVSTSISQTINFAKKEQFFDGTLRINETINGIVADSIFHVLNNDMKMGVKEIVNLEAGDSDRKDFDIFISGNSCMSIEIEDIHIVLNTEKLAAFKEHIAKFDYLSVSDESADSFFGEKHVDNIDQTVITVYYDSEKLGQYLPEEFMGLVTEEYDFEIEVA